MDVENTFTPLEPAFLVKTAAIDDLPDRSAILVYIPVRVVELMSDDFLKVKTLQGNHMYLTHRDLLIKTNQLDSIFKE